MEEGVRTDPYSALQPCYQFTVYVISHYISKCESLVKKGLK
jgi:hypothetical protein